MEWYINPHDGSEQITEDLIGTKLGEIKLKVVGSGKTQCNQLQDGDATMVSKGTMVYEVSGTDNIAVKIDNQWIMYKKIK